MVYKCLNFKNQNNFKEGIMNLRGYVDVVFEETGILTGSSIKIFYENRHTMLYTKLFTNNSIIFQIKYFFSKQFDIF